jgi:hypothetical protein
MACIGAFGNVGRRSISLVPTVACLVLVAVTFARPLVVCPVLRRKAVVSSSRR